MRSFCLLTICSEVNEFEYRYSDPFLSVLTFELQLYGSLDIPRGSSKCISKFLIGGSHNGVQIVSASQVNAAHLD
jgi:hypothetical protein